MRGSAVPEKSQEIFWKRVTTIRSAAEVRENRAKIGAAGAGFAVQNLSVEWGICAAAR
jgi:hypothetical protein